MLRTDTFALTLLLAALSAVGPLTTDMYLPSLPDMTHLLGGTTAQGQLTVSSYLIGFAVGQILYGPISDRHGRRPVILGALALYIFATVVCALSTSIHMLIAARALQALGGCGGTVLARAVVRDVHSGTRAGRELSLISSVMGLAPIVAPIIGGTVHALFGWREVFFTLAGAGFACAVAVWLLLPETLKERAAEPVSFLNSFRSYRVVARNPAYLAYLGLATACYAGLFAWISAASFVLQGLYGLEPFRFSVIFTIASIGYVTGATIAARLVVRLGIDKIIGCGSITIALGGLGVIAAVAMGLTSPFSIVLPMAVYLAGMGMVLPASFAGALTPFPERAGAASALLGFVQQSGASICGIIVGSVLGASAWPLAIGVSVMGCATLLLWIATRGVRARAGAKV